MKRRTWFSTVALVTSVSAAVVAGCGGSNGKTATPTSAPSSTSTPAKVVTGDNAASGIKVLTGTATGQSPCEKAAPTPASPGEVGAGGAGSSNTNGKLAVVAGEHGARGMVAQVPLTYAQRMTLQQQMEAARTVITRYPTTKDALAAGYVMSTPYVPCIGAHYTNVSLARSFDPSHPSELLYDGTQPDSKIVGLSYLVWHPGGAPDGFAGPNDHWHQHNANGGLCIRGALVVGGEETTRAECAARGGTKTLLIDIWMLHAWVVPGFECSWGVFSGECPELGGRICGNAWDAPDPNGAATCKLS